MKKVFALILVLAMALTLWACSLFKANDIDYKPLSPDTQEEVGGNNTESGSTPAESVPDASAGNNVTPSQGSSSSGNNGGSNSGSTTAPTTKPTTAPTTKPTTKPTTQPTTAPTTKPTTTPTTQPTTRPVSSAAPSVEEEDTDIHIPIESLK